MYNQPAKFQLRICRVCFQKIETDSTKEIPLLIVVGMEWAKRTRSCTNFTKRFFLESCNKKRPQRIMGIFRRAEYPPLNITHLAVSQYLYLLNVNSFKNLPEVYDRGKLPKTILRGESYFERLSNIHLTLLRIEFCPINDYSTSLAPWTLSWSQLITVRETWNFIPLQNVQKLGKCDNFRTRTGRCK